MIWTDSMIYSVHADYSCLCNHKVQADIYTIPSDQGTPLGSIDKFDCIPIHGQIVDGFREIEFKHQIAYIKEDDQVKSQMCPGEKQDSDRVTTNTPESTTSTHLQAITSQSTHDNTLTKTKPSVTTTLTSATPTPVATTILQLITSTTTSVKTSCPSSVTNTFHSWKHTIFGGSCYQVVEHSATFDQAESSCRGMGGHLMHIQSAAEQDFITKFLQANYNHEVWIGLGDHLNEEIWTWISGVPLNYTHWDPQRKDFFFHGFEDCVVLEPNRQGYWDDRRCDGLYASGHSYVCQYVTTNTPEKTTSTHLQSITSLPQNKPTVTTSTTQAQVATITQPLITSTTTKTTTSAKASCPPSVTNYFHNWKHTIFGGSCYQVVEHSETFDHAESACRGRGGHLIHIQSAAEQDFITKFLQANYNQEVWIGLGDNQNEEIWTWTSGVLLSYTHWDPHRKDFFLHGFEDCVVLKPSNHGYWDDMRCDGLLAAGHPYICQYDAHVPAVIVG